MLNDELIRPVNMISVGVTTVYIIKKSDVMRYLENIRNELVRIIKESTEHDKMKMKEMKIQAMNTITLESLSMISKLGKGMLGRVTLVQRKSDGAKFALKSIVC